MTSSVHRTNGGSVRGHRVEDAGAPDLQGIDTTRITRPCSPRMFLPAWRTWRLREIERVASSNGWPVSPEGTSGGRLFGMVGRCSRAFWRAPPSTPISRPTRRGGQVSDQGCAADACDDRRYGSDHDGSPCASREHDERPTTTNAVSARICLPRGHCSRDDKPLVSQHTHASASPRRLWFDRLTRRLDVQDVDRTARRFDSQAELLLEGGDELGAARVHRIDPPSQG